MVAVCEVETAAIVAVKETVVEPEAMVAVGGTLTELLVVASVTTIALEDFVFRETVHDVFPAPVNTVSAHTSDFSPGVPDEAGAGEREMEKAFATFPWVAVIVPVSSELTLATVAANFTLLAPAGTLTDVGTEIVELLLDRCTCIPPEGAAMLV